MNVVFSVSYTGNPDADDTRTAKQIIFKENQRLASLNPPGTPLPATSNAEVKSSYLAILTAGVTVDHLSNIRLNKNALYTRFTPEQIEEMNANLLDQAINGASIASIIAKTV